jgi:predicted RNA binding protein YcfA (HicA-like mRNA interferase family)
LGRLKPQPFREIKRRLESVGFSEATQKGTLRSILRQAHIETDDWEKLG